MNEIRIGLLQLHNVADVETNIKHITEHVNDLAKRGVQLVVLQELHNSLYFCQVEDVNNFDRALR